MNRTMMIVAVAALAVALASPIAAQWPDYPSRNIPRNEDGTPNLTAPTPRRDDGKPDLSGIWAAGAGGGRGRGGGRGGREGGAAPEGPPLATFFNVGAGFADGLPFQPWARELREQRLADDMKDNPDAWCLPMGFMQFHLHPQPRRMVHTDDLLLIQYEANYGLRTIFLDGRELPPQGEPQPWWYGYSVGRWDGDDLVVETNNLRGAPRNEEEITPLSTIRDGWLDVNGTPYSDQARFIERFRRPTFGTLQIDVTLDDPKAYTAPWTVRVNQRLLPGEEIIEFICNENERSTPHF